MGQRTRSIFLAGIFIFLLVFLFRSTPVEEEASRLTPTSTTTTALSFPQKFILPPTEPRVYLGAPEEIQNGAFVFSDRFGEVGVVSIANPSTPVASWFNGSVSSHLLDWNAENCEFIYIHSFFISTTNIFGTPISTNDVLLGLNLPSSGTLLSFSISPDLTKIAVWYTTDSINATYQDILTINQHLSFFYLDDPENEIHITDNQGRFSTSTPSANWSRGITWSSDSNSIVYTDNDPNGIRQVFIYDLVNHSRTTVSRFTYQPGGITGGAIININFSPSGERISYELWNPTPAPSDPTGIYVWDITSGDLLVRLDDYYYVTDWSDDQTILISHPSTNEIFLYHILEERFETLLAPPESIIIGDLGSIPGTSLYFFSYFISETRSTQMRVIDLETRDVYVLPGIDEVIPLFRLMYARYIPNSESNDCFPVILPD